MEKLPAGGNRKGMMCAGSLTVEASLLMPLIIFIIIALIYLTFFMHDSCIMQSQCLRSSEACLWSEKDAGAQDADRLLMMKVTEMPSGSESVLSGVKDWLACQKTAEVHVNGSMSAGMAGLVPYLGNGMKSEKSMRSVRINYREDRLRKKFVSGIFSPDPD